MLAALVVVDHGVMHQVRLPRELQAAARVEEALLHQCARGRVPRDDLMRQRAPKGPPGLLRFDVVVHVALQLPLPRAAQQFRDRKRGHLPARYRLQLSAQIPGLLRPGDAFEQRIGQVAPRQSAALGARQAFFEGHRLLGDRTDETTASHDLPPLQFLGFQFV